MTARLLHLLEQRGVATEPVLAKAGLSRGSVEASVPRVPYEACDRLVCAVADALGEAGLGAAIAAVYDAETYDAAGHVLLGSATFGEGLTRSFVYQRLWGDGARFALEGPHGGRFSVVFRHPGKSMQAARILTETAFCEVLGAARVLVTPSATPHEVSFAMPRPHDEGPWEALFGVAPVFGAAESRIVFGEALYAAPIVLPEGTLAAIVERAAVHALGRLPERTDLTGRVVALLEAYPDSLEATLSDTATRLHMSPRTLQRKLAAEGATYDTLVDTARRRLDTNLRARGATTKEIVVWLGFRDTSALRRARLRWTRGT